MHDAVSIQFRCMDASWFVHLHDSNDRSLTYNIQLFIFQMEMLCVHTVENLPVHSQAPVSSSSKSRQRLHVAPLQGPGFFYPSTVGIPTEYRSTECMFRRLPQSTLHSLNRMVRTRIDLLPAQALRGNAAMSGGCGQRSAGSREGEWSVLSGRDFGLICSA